MAKRVERAVFAQGDRVIIVGSLPERGLHGAVVRCAMYSPRAYVVQLDRQRHVAPFFADDLVREVPFSPRDLTASDGRPRGSRSPD